MNNINLKLYLLKGFACIGVVLIHIRFPGIFGDVIASASAYAVPVFFMITGYYAWGKEASVVKRRLIKTIKVFIYAYILFFACYIAPAVKNHEIDIFLAKVFNWATPIKYICFCTIDFAKPLWYLIAMIESYCVWYYIVKNRKERFAVKTLPVLFVLQILVISYCETMQLAWFWKSSFITRAMPWFLLGYYMHTEEAEKVRDTASYKLIVLALVGCVIAVIPTAFNLAFKFNVIGYIPYAFSLFTLSLKNPSNSVCKTIEYIGEKLSLNIYILHVPISNVVDFVFNKLFGINGGKYLLCRPVIVLICTIIASWIMYTTLRYIKKRTKSAA